MADKLNEQVLAVVRQNLPEQVANEMKEYLALAEENKKSLEVALRANILLSEQKLELDKKLSQYSNLEIRETEVLKKNTDLVEMTRQLTIKEKDIQIQAKDTIISNMFTVMQLFVKNPRAIEIMAYSDSGNINEYNSRNCESKNTSSLHNGNRTTESVETKEMPNTGMAPLPHQD